MDIPLKYSKSAFELCNAASANQTSRSESEFREAEDVKMEVKGRRRYFCLKQRAFPGSKR